MVNQGSDTCLSDEGFDEKKKCREMTSLRADRETLDLLFKMTGCFRERWNFHDEVLPKVIYNLLNLLEGGLQPRKIYDGL